jgi:hypothetical protein
VLSPGALCTVYSVSDPAIVVSDPQKVVSDPARFESDPARVVYDPARVVFGLSPICCQVVLLQRVQTRVVLNESNLLETIHLLSQFACVKNYCL